MPNPWLDEWLPEDENPYLMDVPPMGPSPDPWAPPEFPTPRGDAFLRMLDELSASQTEARPPQGFLDRFALGLHANPPQMQGQPRNGLEAFLGGLIPSAAQGFSRGRIQSRGLAAPDLRGRMEMLKLAGQGANVESANNRNKADAAIRMRGLRAGAEKAAVPKAELTPEQKGQNAGLEERAKNMTLYGTPTAPERPTNQNAVSRLADDIRSDPDVKDFVTVRDNYRRVEDAEKSATGIGDLALIFSYMRVLDPQSVVRETEFKNAAEAIGRIPMLQTVPRKWIQGDRLTPEGRKAFLDETRKLYQGKLVAHRRAVEMYKKRAEKEGVDPSLVLRDYETENRSGRKVWQRVNGKLVQVGQ